MEKKCRLCREESHLISIKELHEEFETFQKDQEKMEKINELITLAEKNLKNQEQIGKDLAIRYAELQERYHPFVAQFAEDEFFLSRWKEVMEKQFAIIRSLVKEQETIIARRETIADIAKRTKEYLPAFAGFEEAFGDEIRDSQPLLYVPSDIQESGIHSSRWEIVVRDVRVLNFPNPRRIEETIMAHSVKQRKFALPKGSYIKVHHCDRDLNSDPLHDLAPGTYECPIFFRGCKTTSQLVLEVIPPRISMEVSGHRITPGARVIPEDGMRQQMQREMQNALRSLITTEKLVYDGSRYRIRNDDLVEEAKDRVISNDDFSWYPETGKFTTVSVTSNGNVYHNFVLPEDSEKALFFGFNGYLVIADGRKIRVMNGVNQTIFSEDIDFDVTVFDNGPIWVGTKHTPTLKITGNTTFCYNLTIEK
jgi:hypothetical protein